MAVISRVGEWGRRDATGPRASVSGYDYVDPPTRCGFDGRSGAACSLLRPVGQTDRCAAPSTLSRAGFSR